MQYIEQMREFFRSLGIMCPGKNEKIGENTSFTAVLSPKNESETKE